MRIINCTQCKGSLKGAPFLLQWEYDWSCCNECGNNQAKILTYHFCSSKCLKEFVSVFHGHKHIWLKDWRVQGILTNKKGVKTVLNRCEICSIVEEKKATQKDIKEWQKSINEFLGDDDESDTIKKPSP